MISFWKENLNFTDKQIQKQINNRKELDLKNSNLIEKQEESKKENIKSNKLIFSNFLEHQKIKNVGLGASILKFEEILNKKENELKNLNKNKIIGIKNRKKIFN